MLALWKSGFDIFFTVIDDSAGMICFGGLSRIKSCRSHPTDLSVSYKMKGKITVCCGVKKNFWQNVLQMHFQFQCYGIISLEWNCRMQSSLNTNNSLGLTLGLNCFDSNNLVQTS